MRYHAFASAALMAACIGTGCTTNVIVVDSSGTPVPSAQIYLNGVLAGRTSNTGEFRFSPQLSAGDNLFARHLVYEHPSYRPDHGTGSGWVSRTYLTSRKVENTGSV